MAPRPRTSRASRPEIQPIEPTSGPSELRRAHRFRSRQQGCHHRLRPLSPDSYALAMLGSPSHHFQLKQLFGFGKWRKRLAPITFTRLPPGGAQPAPAAIHLIRLAPGSDPELAGGTAGALVCDERGSLGPGGQRKRACVALLQWNCAGCVPRALPGPAWEGNVPRIIARLWLLKPHGPGEGCAADDLASQLVSPGAELLGDQVAQALEISAWKNGHWRQAGAVAGPRLDAKPALPAINALAPASSATRQSPTTQVPLAAGGRPRAQLLKLFAPCPIPWPDWLASAGPRWASWATADRQQLQGQLHRQPLENRWSGWQGACSTTGRGCLVGQLGEGSPPSRHQSPGSGYFAEPPLSGPTALRTCLASRPLYRTSPHYGHPPT